MTPRDALDACHHLAWIAAEDAGEDHPHAADCWEVAEATNDHANPLAVTDDERAQGYIACAIRLLHLAETDGDEGTKKMARNALRQLAGVPS